MNEIDFYDQSIASTRQMISTMTTDLIGLRELRSDYQGDPLEAQAREIGFQQMEREITQELIQQYEHLQWLRDERHRYLNSNQEVPVSEPENSN